MATRQKREAASASPAQTPAGDALALLPPEEAGHEARRKIDAGDGQELIEQLLTWCLIPEPMPRWLRDELFTRLWQFKTHSCRTLDEAFAVGRPKGYSQRAAQRQADISWQVFLGVSKLVEAGVQLSNVTIAAVGADLGVEETTARKYFKHQLKLQGWTPTFAGADPAYLPPRLMAIFRQLKRPARIPKKRA